MKKMILALVMMLTATMSANAMSYEQARNEALFLTDKMAYELNLTDAQYEAAYEINLDYLMGVTSYDDVYGVYWERRNLDLSYILYSWQWEAFRAATYFYRPLYWDAGYWHFGIYARYPHRDYFYFGRPHFYATYRGGHSWHLNGGRSYYHGRADHFRPALGSHRQHTGMRNSYDRGDYNRSHNYRGSNSSTRVTGGRNGNMDHNRGGNYDNGRNNSGYNNRRFGGGSRNTMDRPTTTTRSTTTTTTTRSTTTAPTRSFGGSRSSMGSNSAPTRSHMSGSRSGSMGNSRSSAAPSRSSGGSSHSSNSHGHFGGSRR